MNKDNSVTMVLSILLLISCLVAGFFAYQTQKLVKDIQKIKIAETSKQTPSPTSTAEPKIEEIIISNPLAGSLVTSPVEVNGTIDKNWTFESTFSIEILDGSRKSLNTLPVGVTFKDEQTQTGTFSTTIPFKTKEANGFIIIHADNPSGLPQNDKSFEIPIKFTADLVACTMEAKICPDGSYVGRSGPKCEFATCPTPKP